MFHILLSTVSSGYNLLISVPKFCFYRVLYVNPLTIDFATVDDLKETFLTLIDRSRYMLCELTTRCISGPVLFPEFLILHVFELKAIEILVDV